MSKLFNYLDSLTTSQDYQALALSVLTIIKIVAVIFALSLGIAKLTDNQLSKNDTFKKR